MYELQQRLRQSRKANENAVIAEKRRQQVTAASTAFPVVNGSQLTLVVLRVLSVVLCLGCARPLNRVACVVSTSDAVLAISKQGVHLLNNQSA